MRGSCVAFLHVFPVARRCAANFFVLVQLVELGELLIRELLDAAASFGVLRAALARFVAIGAEHPGVALRNLVAVLVEEVDVVDLLEGATGEPGLVLDQILQMRLGGDHVVAQHRLVPGPVGTGPHGVNARKTAAVARDDAAGREQEARQRDDACRTSSSRHRPDRTTAGCRRRCRARSGESRRASPRSSTARPCR